MPKSTPKATAHFSQDPLVKYVFDHSIKLHPCQKKLMEITGSDKEYRMQSTPDEAQLLQNLCRTIGAKKTIDIGVYTGFSAMSIALVLPPGGRVVALDITDEYLKNHNVFDLWKEAGVHEKIDFRKGNALDSLKNLLATEGEGSFDFCFIDADKVQYCDYYELCLKLTRSGGIIAIDNTLWGGYVIDPSKTDPDTEAIRKVNDLVASDDRVHVSFLMLADGCTLCFKK